MNVVCFLMNDNVTKHCDLQINLRHITPRTLIFKRDFSEPRLETCCRLGLCDVVDFEMVITVFITAANKDRRRGDTKANLETKP